MSAPRLYDQEAGFSFSKTPKPSQKHSVSLENVESESDSEMSDEGGSESEESYEGPYQLLIVNPNTSTAITNVIRESIETLDYPEDEVEFTYFTAPSGPASIDSNADATESARQCLPQLIPELEKHDGVLLACFSQHPLVIQMKEHSDIPVLSILEASVLSALPMLTTSPKDPSGPTSRFGIVTTGKVWAGLLPDAIEEFLGGPSKRFAGVETTGLNASELHGTLSQKEVAARMVRATKRLVDRTNVDVVVLGCAGMGGMEETVRAAAGEGMFVIDGVKTGVGILLSLIKADV